MLKLRKTAPMEPLIVSMAGLRLGDSVLFLGCRDPKAIARLAVKPGLSGRAVAVDDDARRIAAAAAAAEGEGALLETHVTPMGSLPLVPETFDVVVAARLLGALDASARTVALSEASRVLRPGGRCVVIEAGRGGLTGFFTGGRTIPARELEMVLQTADFRGVRTLAERGGLLFLEAARPK